jgi:Prolipoprotein diacylglyceryl transferase
LVGVGVVLAWTGPPGAALTFLIISYGLVRFILEFVRGDGCRPYILGFSEAQWTSILFMIGVIVLEFAGYVPVQYWHIGATALAMLIMVSAALRRWLTGTQNYELLHPRHVTEVAEVLHELAHAQTNGPPLRSDAVPMGLRVGATSRGIVISAGRHQETGGCVEHYSLSATAAPLTEWAADTLAKLILRLRNPGARSEMFRGNHDVFHMLIHSQPQPPASLG